MAVRQLSASLAICAPHISSHPDHIQQRFESGRFAVLQLGNNLSRKTFSSLAALYSISGAHRLWRSHTIPQFHGESKRKTSLEVQKEVTLLQDLPEPRAFHSRISIGGTTVSGVQGLQRTYAKTTSGDASTAAQEPGVETVGFNDGSSTRFAPLINGCWTLAGGHGRVVESEILGVMEMYTRSGLTSFDTADIYGPSEKILGVFRERWGNERKEDDAAQDVQVFTKFVPNIFRVRPTPQVVEQSIKHSMDALRTSRLDLVQLHWWDYEVPGMVDVAKSLADLREKGLITSIGTTNMSTKALGEIVDAGVPVVCNQVQFSLLDQRPRMAMIKYCKEKDIKLFTYGTLAAGLLSNRYLEEGKRGLFGEVSYTTPDLNTSSLKMYWRTVREAGGDGYWRRLLTTLGGIASSKGVSIAAVALRWAMQQGPVHPIVGLRNAEHLEDNLTALTFYLEPAEMDQIEEVLVTSRGPSGDCYEMERSS